MFVPISGPAVLPPTWSGIVPLPPNSPVASAQDDLTFTIISNASFYPGGRKWRNPRFKHVLRRGSSAAVGGSRCTQSPNSPSRTLLYSREELFLVFQVLFSLPVKLDHWDGKVVELQRFQLRLSYPSLETVPIWFKGDVDQDRPKRSFWEHGA